MVLNTPGDKNVNIERYCPRTPFFCEDWLLSILEQAFSSVN